jgi:hypothetical protein
MPLVAAAVPNVTGVQLFTDNVGPNPFGASGWRLLAGATSITSAGAISSVQALHQGGVAGWDYDVPATPSPVFPASYFASVPYTDQSGRWWIKAIDAAGSTSVLSHALDDPRQLPLVQDLDASGPVLTPTVTWTRMDPSLYPSACTSCLVGFDFFNYAVVVRNSAGALIYQSPGIMNRVDIPTQWTLPAGVLSEGERYAIGVRLNMSELEAINANGSFVSPLENRSSAYLAYTAAVPEPGSAAMLLAGLVGLAGLMLKSRRGVDAAVAPGGVPG